MWTGRAIFPSRSSWNSGSHEASWNHLRDVGKVSGKIKLLIGGTIWRRGRDLNPRYPLRYVRFRGGSFQPLTHLSAPRLREWYSGSGNRIVEKPPWFWRPLSF